MIRQLHTTNSPVTASGVTGSLKISNSEAIALFTNVTAVSGTTPTLDIKLQESPDGTTWYDIPSFAHTQFTTTGNERIAVPTVGLKLADFVRISFTITGTTPSFTFETHLALNDYLGDA